MADLYENRNRSPEECTAYASQSTCTVLLTLGVAVAAGQRDLPVGVSWKHSAVNKQTCKVAEAHFGDHGVEVEQAHQWVEDSRKKSVKSGATPLLSMIVQLLEVAAVEGSMATTSHTELCVGGRLRHPGKGSQRL